MNGNRGKRWTRDELLLAIGLYCKTPFGRIHQRNPEIVELAALLGRTPGSVSYKLANFAAIDPTLDRAGAGNTSTLDQAIWQEFYGDWSGMIRESERRLAELRGNSFSVEIPTETPTRTSREATLTIRINQGFFRRMILSSYGYRCCITGLPIERLLVASHIVPWAKDEGNRLNPCNGLCLNALHDKAFDVGLITLDQSYRVVLCDDIRRERDEGFRLLTSYEGKQITMPSRFLPDQKLLAYHRSNVFIA